MTCGKVWSQGRQSLRNRPGWEAEPPLQMLRRQHACIRGAPLRIVDSHGVIVQWRDAHSLPAQATAHVTAEHEAAALQARQPLPEARIEAAFDAHGLHLLAAPPSGIAYLANCSVGGSDGLHMVMDSSAGPVSVLYLRGRKVDACVDFHRDGLVGRIVPLADGALVMLAREDRDFDGIEAAWRNALEGPRTAARGTL